MHAVDPTLEGTEPATVLYIPTVPFTKRNILYIARQREKLLNRGETPPDFARRGVQFEEERKGWLGAAEITHLQGQQALGLAKLSGEGPLVQWANEVLGYA